MKKFIAVLFLLCIIALAISAAPALLVGSLQTVNNTTFNSSTNLLSLNYPTPQQLTVTHGGLASGSDVAITYQVSTDRTNWISFAAITMANTNSTTEVFQGYNLPVTNYFRVQVTTTNSQAVSVSYGN